MAATTTTLAAAMRVSDLTAVLTSATGAVKGNTILIGGEYMQQTGDPVGVIIPVARGLNGSAQIAHAAATSVRMGLASDFNVPVSIQASVYTDTSLLGDGSSARPLSAVGDGTGDVVGPASAVSGDVVSFSGTTGKLVADSGKLAADLVTGPASVTTGRVTAFSGTTGKVIVEGTQLVADLVSGPASVTTLRVAVFNGTTGKIIAEGTQLAADLVSGPASVTAGKVVVFSGTTGKIVVADAAGVTAGPFTTITSITVVNGLVTALTGA